MIIQTKLQKLNLEIITMENRYKPTASFIILENLILIAGACVAMAIWFDSIIGFFQY